MCIRDSYQIQFGDNGEFADAVAELLRHLKEKVWLVGQSLGLSLIHI